MAAEQGGGNDFLIAVQLENFRNLELLAAYLEDIRRTAAKGAVFKLDVDADALAQLERRIATSIKVAIDAADTPPGTTRRPESSGSSDAAGTDSADFIRLKGSLDELRTEIGKLVEPMDKLRAAVNREAVEGGSRRRGTTRRTAPNGATIIEREPLAPAATVDFDATKLSATLTDAFATVTKEFTKSLRDTYAQVAQSLDLSNLLEESEQYRRARAFGVTRPVRDYSEAIQRYRNPGIQRDEREYLRGILFDSFETGFRADKENREAQEETRRRRAALRTAVGDDVPFSERQLSAAAGRVAFRAPSEIPATELRDLRRQLSNLPPPAQAFGSLRQALQDEIDALTKQIVDPPTVAPGLIPERVLADPTRKRRDELVQRLAALPPAPTPDEIAAREAIEVRRQQLQSRLTDITASGQTGLGLRPDDFRAIKQSLIEGLNASASALEQAALREVTEIPDKLRRRKLEAEAEIEKFEAIRTDPRNSVRIIKKASTQIANRETLIRDLEDQLRDVEYSEEQTGRQASGRRKRELAAGNRNQARALERDLRTDEFFELPTGVALQARTRIKTAIKTIEGTISANQAGGNITSEQLNTELNQILGSNPLAARLAGVGGQDPLLVRAANEAKREIDRLRKERELLPGVEETSKLPAGPARQAIEDERELLLLAIREAIHQYRQLSAPLKSGAFNLSVDMVSELKELRDRLAKANQALTPLVQYAVEFRGTKVPPPPTFGPLDFIEETKDAEGRVTAIKSDEAKFAEVQRAVEAGYTFKRYGPDQEQVLLNAIAFKEKAVREALQRGDERLANEIEAQRDSITKRLALGGEYHFAGPRGERPFEEFKSLRGLDLFPDPKAIPPELQERVFDVITKAGIRPAGAASFGSLSGALGAGGEDAALLLRAMAGSGAGLNAESVTEMITKLAGVDVRQSLKGVTDLNAQIAILGKTFATYTPAQRKLLLADLKAKDLAQSVTTRVNERVAKTDEALRLDEGKKSNTKTLEADKAKARADEKIRETEARETERRTTQTERFTLARGLTAFRERFRFQRLGRESEDTRNRLAALGITGSTGSTPNVNTPEPQLLKGLDDNLRKFAGAQERLSLQESRISVLGALGQTNSEQSRLANAGIAADNFQDQFFKYLTAARGNASFGERFVDFDTRRLQADPNAATFGGPNSIVDQLDRTRTARESLSKEFIELQALGRRAQDPTVRADSGELARIRQELKDRRASLQGQGFISTGTARAGDRVTGTARLQRAIRDLRIEEESARNATIALGQEFVRSLKPMKETETFLGGVERKFKALAQYAGAGFFIYGAVQGIRQMTREVITLESELARVRGVFQTRSLSDSLQIEQGVIQAAKDYGVQINEALRLAKVFAQTGLPPAQAIQQTRAALLGVQGAGLEPQQTVETLVAVENISQGGVSAGDILDRISRIEARNAVTAQDLSVAIQRVGSLAQQLQPDRLGSIDAFDTVIASVTQIVESTRVSGNQAATSLRFILSRLTAPDIAKSLQQNFGVKLAANEQGTELRPLLDILANIAEQYKQLTGSGQTVRAAQLLQTVAGARQVNAAAALFGNFEKVLGTANESAQAYGDTQARLAIQQETLDFKLKQLDVSFTDFGNSLLKNTGLLGGMGLAVEFLTGTLSLLSGRSTGEPGKPNAFYQGVLPTLLPIAAGVTSLVLGNSAGNKATSIAADKAATALTKNFGTMLGWVSKLNVVGAVLAGVFAGLALIAAGRAIYRVLSGAEREDRFGFRRVDRKQLEDSETNVAFENRARSFGLAPEALRVAIRSAAEAARVATGEAFPGQNLFTTDDRARTPVQGTRETFQDVFVKTLSEAVPELQKITDQSQRTAEALKLLDDAAHTSFLATGLLSSQLVAQLEDERKNILGRFQATGRISPFDPGSFERRFAGLNIDRQRVQALRGRDDLLTIRQEASRVLRNVVGDRLGVALDTRATVTQGGQQYGLQATAAQFIRDEGLTYGRALDKVAKTYLVLNAEQEALVRQTQKQLQLGEGTTIEEARAELVRALREQGTAGGRTADVVESRARFQQTLLEGLEEQFNLAGRIGEAADATGSLAGRLTAGGALFEEVMNQDLIQAMKTVAEKLRKQGAGVDATRLLEATALLGDPRSGRAFNANIQGGRRGRPGRDELLEVIGRYGQRRGEIDFADRAFRDIGFGFDATQERATASSGLLRDLGGVRARVEAELFQLYQQRGQFQELAAAGLKTIRQTDQVKGDEIERDAASKDFLSAASLTAAGVDSNEVSRLNDRIAFITESLRDLETSGELFANLPDELRNRIQRILTEGGGFVELIQTFADVTRAVKSVVSEEQRLVAIRQQGRELLRSSQDFERDRLQLETRSLESRFDVDAGRAEALGGPAAGLQFRLLRPQLERQGQLTRVRLEFEQAMETARRAFAETGNGFQLAVDSFTADLKRINGEELASIEARRNSEEALANVRLELLRASTESADQTSRQALSGVRDLLSGGFDGLRGQDREGRSGVSLKALADRLVQPFVQTLQERLADNFIESLIGQNGVLGLRELFSSDLLLEQQLLQQHRALELLAIEKGARDGVTQGFYQQRLDASRKFETDLGNVTPAAAAAAERRDATAAAARTELFALRVGPPNDYSGIPIPAPTPVDVRARFLGGGAGSTIRGVGLPQVPPVVPRVAPRFIPTPQQAVAGLSFGPTAPAAPIALPGVVVRPRIDFSDVVSGSSTVTTPRRRVDPALNLSQLGVLDPDRLDLLSGNYSTTGVTRDGRVPTHNVYRPSGRDPNETFEAYESRVLGNEYSNLLFINRANRSLKSLAPEVQPQFKQLLEELKKQGINAKVNEAFRSTPRQEALFQIGRLPNDKRNPVTWTLTSNHQDARAIDIRIPGGTTEDYLKAQKIAEGLGLGFRTLGEKDLGHIELPQTAASKQFLDLFPSDSTKKAPRTTTMRDFIRAATKSTDDYAASKQRLNELTSGAFADSLYQIAGRRPNSFGIVGGREYTSDDKLNVKGQYFIDGTKRLELAAYELKRRVSGGFNKDSVGLGLPPNSRFDIETVFAHEMGHFLDEVNPGFREAFNKTQAGPYAFNARGNKYASGDPDEYFAEAFAAAINTLRLTRTGSDRQQIFEQFDTVENRLHGAKPLAQALLAHPLYRDHPARAAYDIDTVTPPPVRRLGGALVTGNSRGRALRFEDVQGQLPPADIGEVLRTAYGATRPTPPVEVRIPAIDDLVDAFKANLEAVPNVSRDEIARAGEDAAANAQQYVAQQQFAERLRKAQADAFKRQLSALGGSLAGGYLGGTLLGRNSGFNYGSEGASLGATVLPQAVQGVGSLLGSSLGTVGTLFGGPLGGLIGGLAGGLLGGLFKKEKPKPPVEYAQAQRIERNTAETVTAIENQTRNLLTLDDRLLNVPASFTLPQYRPLTAGAGLAGGGGGNTTYVDLTMPVHTSADPREIARHVSAELSRQLGSSGTHVSLKNR